MYSIKATSFGWLVECYAKIDALWMLRSVEFTEPVEFVHMMCARFNGLESRKVKYALVERGTMTHESVYPRDL